MWNLINILLVQCKLPFYIKSSYIHFVLTGDKYGANRERKSQKRNFSEDSMREAVLVEQGMSIRKAAKEKGVTCPTLIRYVRKMQKQMAEMLE
jgi:hypothetical protein